MAKFVLTAQMQLQAPTNLTQVRRQIQQQLGNVTINPVINTQALANANQQISNVGKTAAKATKNLNNASRSAQSLGASLGAAARRFASITLATGFFLGLARGISEAFGKAIEFEREILKISQVTGKSTQSLRNLTSEVTRLSTSLGVSSSELLTASRTLSQAGFSALKTKQALEVLARTDLAATFDNLADTTEGAIAILRQFRNEARATGGDIKFLEQSLDAINAVSKSFAVESADLIAAVRRTGGVFEAAGGKLNELIALFTSVRATTRETAETIATGFRTIFTRIQRTETIEQLRELGIELRNAKGEFVGPLEAIKRLQIGLAGLSATDFRFQEIIEQLGGFRQVGKVIPLLKQYDTTVQALSIANLSAGSTARDAATAQQGLGNAFAKLSEKFNATIRSIADSDTFQSLARGAISLAESILKVVKALEPLLPLLTSLAAFKLGQIAVPALGRFSGITGRNQGGQIYGFNKGGFVPGTGNRDTVPAMLTPGEFVIKKSSVNSIGAQRLAAMNGYTNGGKQSKVAGFNTGKLGALAGMSPTGTLGFRAMPNTVAAVSMNPIGYDGQYNPTKAYGIERADKLRGVVLPAKERKLIANKYFGGDEKQARVHKYNFSVLPPSTPYKVSSPQLGMLKSSEFGTIMDQVSRSAISDGVESAIAKISGQLDLPPALDVNENNLKKAQATSAADDTAARTFQGFLYEGVIGALTGAMTTGGTASFDLGRTAMAGNRKRLKKMFNSQISMAQVAEVKRSKDQAASQEGIPKKLYNYIARSGRSALRQGMVQLAQYNKGGSVDTVPAMLTPGEYVINKSAAEAIGYTNLNRMNQTGVAHFNKGGAVGGVQFLNRGGMASGIGNAAMMAAFMAPMAIEFTNLNDKTKQVIQQFTMLGGILGMIGAQIGSAFGNFIAQMIYGTKVQQASNASEAAESATNIEAVATETAENVANMKAAAMSLGFGILGAAVGVVAAAFMTYNAQLKEERKRMAQSFTDFVTKIQEGAAANAAGVNEATQSMLGAFDVSDRQLADKASAKMEQVRASVAVSGRGMGGAVNIDLGQVFTDELNRLKEEAGPARNTIMAMADATIAAATSVGQFNSQTKILAEKGLKGDALIKEQTRIADQFLANSRSAKNLKNEFDRLDQQFGSGRNQEAYREGVQQLNDVIAEQGKTAFRVADTIRANIQSMTQAIIDGDAVFDQVKYDEQIKRLADSLEQGFFAEAINQGKTVEQAQAFAKKATNESIAARKKGDAEAIKAAQERRAELDSLAKAEVRLMQTERLRAMVMNKLAVNMALANNQFSSATDLIKSFGGTVADTKISIKEITDALKNGFDKRAIEAAKKVSPSIAKNIEEGLKKNESLQTAFDALALTTKGRKLGRQESKDALDRVGIDFEGLDQDVKTQLLELMKDGFDAADVEKATELLGVNVSNQIKLLQDLANAQQKFISTLAESSKQMLAANKDILKARQFELDVRIKGAERIRKALGREITVREAGAQIRARAAAAAGIRGPVDVGGLQNRAAGLIRRRTDVAERRFAGQVNAGGPLAGRAAERDQRLANAQNELNAEIEKTKDALKILADQSDKAAAVMAEIDKEREGREAIASSVKDFTFASNEQRRTMNQEFAALTRVLQTGNLNAIPDQMRAAVGKLLDQFKNVDFGGGLTGGDISKRLQVRQLEQNFRMMSGGRQGAPPQLIKAIFNATTKEEKLINDLRQINQEEQQAAQALRQLEEQEANLMIKVLTNIEQFLRKVMQSIQSTTETGANIDDAAAGGAAVGGIVPVRGFARGGNVFKPRGTDTVPAMLTPGEFVIRKSAVDKIGIGALTSLNNGNVSTVYKNAGGLIEQNVGQLISGSMIAKGNILPNAINAMLIKEGKANAFGRQLQKYDQKDMEKLFGNTMRTVAFLNNYATGYGITKIKERQGINYGRIIAGPGQTMGLANNGAIVLNPALRSGGYLTPAGIFTAIMNNPNEFANKRYNHAAVQQQGLNGPLHKQRIAAATFKSRKQDQTIKKGAAFIDHAQNARSGVEGLLNAYYNPQFFADMATLESIFTQGSGVRFEGTEKFALANVQGLARGGSVDSVPAMLTPGEFVMSRAAVKKHGTGFMNSVNRGKIPGFAKGGSVGGVQYRQNGGAIGGMGQNMMDAIAKSLSIFDNLAGMLNNIAVMFSNLQISHTIQVDGTLNIPGFSQQAINNIVNTIGEQVVSQTEDKINVALDEFNRKLDQRAD